MEKTLKLREALERMALRDNSLMRVMKVTELSHIIARSNLGDLVLKLVKGGKGGDYVFVLDAVPFNDSDNKEIMTLLGGIVINSLTI